MSFICIFVRCFLFFNNKGIKAFNIKGIKVDVPSGRNMGPGLKSPGNMGPGSI